MKSILKGLILLAVIFAVVVPVSADTEFEFSGQIRLREEADKRDFNTDKAWLTTADLRTRFGVEAIVDGNTHVFVQFQDSRRMGGDTQFGARASGQLNDGKNVDVHQAYFQVDRLLVDGLGFKSGRFEMNFGNERVFGAVGWSNVGRAWEGGMGWYDHESYRVTGFGLKATEVNNPYYHADFDIGGLYATCKKVNVDVFWFYEYDADTTGYWYSMNRLDRLNAGTYFKRVYEDLKLDFEFNGVYQWGQQPRGFFSPFEEGIARNRDKVDIAAYMLAFEAGYTLDAPFKGRVALGVDYTSGDDDPDDNKFKAYNNLYPTAHKFNGFMDYFTDAAMSGTSYANAGLVDFMVRASAEPYAGWTAKLDAHFFSTNKDYSYTMIDGSVVASNKVGMELDATLATTVIPGLNLEGGASFFFAEDDFTMVASGVTDADPGMWFYAMTTVNF